MISVVMTSVVDVRTTGVLVWFFLVLVLMVVGAGVLEVRVIGVLAVVELGVVELVWELGLELVFAEVMEVAWVELELELELELQPIDPQSCGVKLYPKLHSIA